MLNLYQVQAARWLPVGSRQNGPQQQVFEERGKVGGLQPAAEKFPARERRQRHVG